MASPPAGSHGHEDAGRPLLAVHDLCIGVEAAGRSVAVVQGVSFTLAAGETLGLVGESGSGKSLTARSLIRLLPRGARITAGRIRFDGMDVRAASPAELRRLRGGRVGFVFQEPAAALSPVATVGAQVREVLLAHEPLARDEADRRATALLAEVGVPDASRRAGEYPHQLSGGLKQRAMIAIALACRPSLLIADEPTTALDARVQADILDLLRDLRARRRLALLLITHDLGVVAQMADRVAVMYAGRIVEEAPTTSLVASPRHPYTRGLLDAIPSGVRGQPLRVMEGAPPVPGSGGPACAFAPRCPRRVTQCSSPPPWHAIGTGHSVLCHVPLGSTPADDTAPVDDAGAGWLRE